MPFQPSFHVSATRNSLTPIIMTARQVPDMEVSALFALYNSTGGDSWRWRNGAGAVWNFTVDGGGKFVNNPCSSSAVMNQTWQGVTCSQDATSVFFSDLFRYHDWLELLWVIWLVWVLVLVKMCPRPWVQCMWRGCDYMWFCVDITHGIYVLSSVILNITIVVAT